MYTKTGKFSVEDYSGFPFSMENIPRQSGFFCLSLKFGCIVAALTSILYTVLGIAQSGAALDAIPKNVDDSSRIFVLSVIIVSILNYGVTFVLSAFLLIGVLWENIKFMRPWIIWFTFQTICYVALFVFFTTIQMINHSNDTPLLIYLIEFMILVIRIYMVILVVSYHKQIKEELHQHKQLEKFVDNEFYYYSI